MKRRHIYLFIISFCTSVILYAQTSTDSIAREETYGLRLGVDLMHNAITFFEDDYKGLEIIGDIRFSRNYYAAVEFGFTEKTTVEDYLNVTTDGSFIKLGVNYNAYKNWTGMRNEIYLGFRYGLGFFNQKLNSYIPNQHGTVFESPPLAVNTEFNDLTAQWIEFIIGLKVETFNNLFLGMGIRLNRMMSTTEPENFRNLFVPGFNRVYSNDVGVGFNYTLSYFIPIIKRGGSK